jgi:hypothetical protein
MIKNIELTKVEENSEKDQMTNQEDLVTFLRRIPCQLLKSGLRPVEARYFFCSCDPDMKEPICEDCKERCHEGHAALRVEENLSEVCACGMKCHSIRDDSTEVNTNYNKKCFFHEFSQISGINIYYESKDKLKVLCMFCYNFCFDSGTGQYGTNVNNLNPLIDYKAYNSVTSINKNSDFFDKKIYTNDMALFPECNCTHYNHKELKYLFGKLKHIASEIFVSLDFENLTHTHITNLLMLSHRSFDNIFHSFIEGMESLDSNIKESSYQFEDLYSPTNEFNLCLETISKISAKTKKMNYFAKKISSCLPSVKTLCTIIERKFDHKMLTIWNMKYNLMTIYLKFGFKKKIKSLPNFKIYDIENMSPLQRLSFVKEVQEKSFFNFNKKHEKNEKDGKDAKDIASMNIHNFVKDYNSNSNSNNVNTHPNKNTFNMVSSIANNNQRKKFLDPHTLDLFLSTLNKLNNIKDKQPETYLVIYRCFQVIKLFAKFSLFSFDQVLKFSSLNDEMILGFSESIKSVNSNDKKRKMKMIDFQFQILSPMVKSIRYLIFHKNDQFVENFLKNSEMKIEQITFYHGKSLISKYMSKNAINIMTYLRYFKQKEYDTNKESQMHKLLSQAFKIISMNISDPDYYSTGLIRLFDTNKQIYLKYLNKNFDTKEKEFITYTNGLSREIEKKYKKYFLFQISYKELSALIVNSIKNLFDAIGVKNYSPNFLKDFVDVDLDRLDNKDELVTVGKKDGKVTLIRRRKTNPNLRDIKDGVSVNSEASDREKVINLQKNENLQKNSHHPNHEMTHNMSQYPVSENVNLHDSYISKLSHKDRDRENSITSYKHKFRILLNKSNLIFSFIKIIKILQLEHISKYKSLESFKIDSLLFDEIVKLLAFFLEDNVDNCIIFLSSDFADIFININQSEGDHIYKYVELLEYAVISLLKANYDFSSNYTLLKIIKEISGKCSINSSKSNVETTTLILQKLFTIIKCCTRLQFVNYEHTEEKLRRIVKNIFKDNPVFKDYLIYLIENKNKNDRRESLDNNNVKNKSQLSKVSSSRNLDINYFQGKRDNIDSGNYVIVENNLSQNEASSSRLDHSHNFNIIEAPPTSKKNTNRELTINTNNECDSINYIDFDSNPVIKNNFSKFLEIINLLFDGDAVLQEKSFLENLIKPEDIPKILKSKSLDLKFRIEILKFFRMVYLDLVINSEKVDLYRNLIINPPRSTNDDENLDIMTSGSGDNDNLKLYEELINITNSTGLNRTSSNQNKINNILHLDSAVMKYELKHFSEILNLNKNLESGKQVEYIEQGLLNPLIVHINKFMSLLYILPVEEYLKLYELVFYFLKLKEYVLLNFSHLFQGDEYDHVVKKLFKNDFGKNSSNSNFQPLIRRDIGSGNNAINELKSVRKDLEEMEEQNFEVLNYGLVFSLFEKHLKNFIYKPRLEKSMKKIFTKRDHYYSEEKIEKMRRELITSNMLKSEFEQRVFDLIIKYRNDKMKLNESYFLTILDEENTHNHLKYRNLVIRSLFFLISDAKASLRYSRISYWAIFKLLQYDTTNVQKCVYELYEQKSNLLDVHELVNLFFTNFMSILFSIVRPSQCTISSTYSTSMTLIKVLKYLCEEHNPKFQKIFFQEVKFRFLPDEYLSNYAGYKQKRLALLQSMNSLNSPVNSSVNQSKSFNQSTSLVSAGSPTNALKKKNSLIRKGSLNQKFKQSKSLVPSGIGMAVIKEKEDYGTNENSPKISRVISPIKKFNDKSESISEENENEINHLESFNKFKQSVSSGNINVNKFNLQMNRISSQSQLLPNDNNSLYYQEIAMFDFLLTVLGKVIFLSKWEQCENDCDEKDLAFYSDIFSVIVELLIEMIQGTEKSNLQSILGGSLTESEEEAAHFIQFLNSVKPLLLNDNNNSIVLLKIRKDVVDFMMAFLEEKSTPIKLVTIMSNVLHPNTIIETIINVMKKLYLKKITESSSNSKMSQLSYKEIQFDYKMSNFFSSVYFQDQDFCQTEEFELANRMYQYVKLLATNEKYAHEDAINIIESVSKFEESIIIKSYDKKKYSSNSKAKNNKDLLENSEKERNEERNKERDHSNHLLSNTEQTFDDNFYETYFCVKFFEKITRTVLVQLDENNNTGEENLPVRVIFTLNPLTMFLSHHTRLAFYEKVNRDGRYIKLYSLMEQSDQFYDEIKYNSESSNKFSRFLNSLNYYYFDLFSFVITVIINILMLVTLSQEEVLHGDDEHTPIINAFAYLTISFNTLVIFCWFYSKYSLYFLIEKKKYLSKRESSDNDTEYKEPTSLTFYGKILIAFNTIVLRNEINSFLWNVILASIAVSNPDFNFVYSVQLFVIVNLSETLKNIIRSVTSKYMQLLTTTMLMFLVCYVYACIAFFYFSEDFIFNIFDPKVIIEI